MQRKPSEQSARAAAAASERQVKNHPPISVAQIDLLGKDRNVNKHGSNRPVHRF